MSLLERCPHFRGWYVQASMELGPEDVSLLERCPHFRGWYVQASMELGPEDVSLLERCPHFRGWYALLFIEVSFSKGCPNWRSYLYTNLSSETLHVVLTPAGHLWVFLVPPHLLPFTPCTLPEVLPSFTYIRSTHDKPQLL